MTVPHSLGAAPIVELVRTTRRPHETRGLGGRDEGLGGAVGAEGSCDEF